MQPGGVPSLTTLVAAACLVFLLQALAALKSLGVECRIARKFQILRLQSQWELPPETGQGFLGLSCVLSRLLHGSLVLPL